VLEDIFDKELARFDICSVELEGVTDLVVHCLEEFHQFLALLAAIYFILLDDGRIYFKDMRF
jgi:hypothetical protein